MVNTGVGSKVADCQRNHRLPPVRSSLTRSAKRVDPSAACRWPSPPTSQGSDPTHTLRTVRLTVCPRKRARRRLHDRMSSGTPVLPIASQDAPGRIPPRDQAVVREDRKGAHRGGLPRHSTLTRQQPGRGRPATVRPSREHPRRRRGRLPGSSAARCGPRGARAPMWWPRVRPPRPGHASPTG